jgi:hypothetical protein
MDLAKAYRTNTAVEEKGAWFQLGDVEFLIARNGNRTYTDMTQQRFEAHRHTLSLKDTPEQRKAAAELADKIEIEVMGAAILLGWRGVESTDELSGEKKVGKVEFDGVELPYTRDNAVKLLGLKDFRSFVNSKAGDFKNFLETAQKADEKN